MVLGQMDVPMQSNKIKPLPHSIYTKLTQNLRAKTIKKKLRKKHRCIICDWIWQQFLRYDTKRQKKIKYISSKLKTSLLQTSPSIK